MIKTGPNRANPGVQTYPKGTWIYPTLAQDPLGLALATGHRLPKIQEQGGRMSSVPPAARTETGPLSPEHCSWTVTACSVRVRQ